MSTCCAKFASTSFDASAGSFFSILKKWCWSCSKNVPDMKTRWRNEKLFSTTTLTFSALFFETPPTCCCHTVKYGVTSQQNPYSTVSNQAYRTAADPTPLGMYTGVYWAVHLFISIHLPVTKRVHEGVCVCVTVVAESGPALTSHRDLTIMWQSCSTLHEMALLHFYIKKSDRIHFK